MKLSEVTGDTPAPLKLSQVTETAQKPTRYEPDLPVPDPFEVGKTVVPPVVNFLTAGPRAIAGDIYATQDAATQAIRGKTPTSDRWWELAGKAADAGRIPETPGGERISHVLNLPGEILGAGITAASHLLMTPEERAALGPVAKTAADVAGTFGGARLLTGRESMVGPPIPKASTDVNLMAADVVGKRFAQEQKAGGLSATEALDKIGKARAAGKPMALVDVGGENLTALGGHVYRQPGESRAIATRFLDPRDQAAAQRLGLDVATYVSGGPTMFETTESLLNTRSRAARPLYQLAEAQQGIWSPRLQEFISEPKVKQGLARGFELERLAALKEGRKFDPTAMGIDLDFEGNIVMKKVPNLRVLDMGKRGLDAMIADERNPLTGRLSALGMELNGVRSAYINEIDGLDRSGAYRAAREAWAGPSQSLDALRWGRTIFNRAPEETARDFAKLAPNNQEFVRLGVADVLRERIAKTGFSGNEARAVIKNPWTRDQLRPIFRSDADFDKFTEAVMSEHQMAATTSRVMRGSQTAERVAEDKTALALDVAPSAAAMATHLLHGNVLQSMIHGWRIQRRLRKDVGEDPALNEAVAKIIFNPAIDLSDPLAQRIVAGPPPSGRGATVRSALSGAGRYGSAAALLGLPDANPLSPQ